MTTQSKAVSEVFDLIDECMEDIHDQALADWQWHRSFTDTIETIMYDYDYEYEFSDAEANTPNLPDSYGDFTRENAEQVLNHFQRIAFNELR